MPCCQTTVSFQALDGEWLDTALALVKDMDVLKHFINKKNEIICDLDGEKCGENDKTNQDFISWPKSL